MNMIRLDLLLYAVALGLRAFILSWAVAVAVLILPYRFLVFLLNPRQFFYVKKRAEPPAVTQDPKFGSHHMAHVNGVSLHYVTKGKRGSPLMLLVHGFPENWWSWRFQLTEFSDEFLVVALDMRGYGDSSKPKDIGAYRISVIVEDLRALIERLGYEQAIVVSHDFGAAISWEFAHKYPAMVTRLVIMDNPPNVVRWKAMLTSRLAFTTLYNFYFQLPYFPELINRSMDMDILEFALTSRFTGVRNKERMTKTDLDMFKYSFAKDGWCEPPFNYYRARWSVAGIVSSLADAIGMIFKRWRIKPKTLILWGAKDDILRPHLAYDSQAYCDDAVVKVIPGASHWLQQDEPDIVNREIREFLKA